jgi:hypothetical protein
VRPARAFGPGAHGLVVRHASLWKIGMLSELLYVSEVEHVSSEASFERHSDRIGELVGPAFGDDLPYQVACFAAFKPTRTGAVFPPIDRCFHF